MTFWHTWWRHPRKVFLRKVAFQVHLWLGLALAAYIVVLSLTGSAIVFRRELDVAFGPKRPPIDRSARVLPPEEIADFAHRAYPDYEIEHVGDFQRRTPVRQVTLRREGDTIERVFNGYTGEDLGDPFPPAAQALLWLVTLHDDLLMPADQRGRFWNGVGSILTTILAVTGLVVWWPGIMNWRRGLTVKWRARWPRLNFDLHSAIGFWFFGIILIWALTGIYLSFPSPFMSVVNTFAGPAPDEIVGTRPVDIAIEWMVRLHFGRWRSHPLKVVWVILGLIPTAMFVTGFVMWWNRVVRKPRLVRERRPLLRLQGEAQGVE